MMLVSTICLTHNLPLPTICVQPLTMSLNWSIQIKQGLIPAPGSAAIIYWYLRNGRGRLIDWQEKILLDGLMDRYINR